MDVFAMDLLSLNALSAPNLLLWHTSLPGTTIQR